MRAGLALRNDICAPLRYSGSKQWLVRRAVEFVGTSRPETFLEPFFDGGAVGMTLLHRDLVGHLIMAELEVRVVAFRRRPSTIHRSPTRSSPSHATERTRRQSSPTRLPTTGPCGPC
jgi:hypothetical protein